MKPLRSSPENSAPSRREFLRLVGGGALALATAGFGSKALAQTPPTYTDMAEELKRRNLRIQQGDMLSGGDDFKEFPIMKGDKVFGRLITLEAAGNGYFDQVICDGDNPIEFETRARQYEAENPNTEVVLQVAGALSCQGEACQTTSLSNYEPDGMVFHRGRSVGWEKPHSKYGGMVILGPDGAPRVIPRSEFDSSRIGTRDAFQTFTLVERGVPQSFVAGPALTRRAIFERYFTDASGSVQNQWAILNLDEPMDLTEFGEFLAKCLGARSAALLDTGGWSDGWLKYEQKASVRLLPTDQHKTPNFTSLLVGVRRK